MVSLVAFDMDGTLLLPNHRFGEETLRTLRRLSRERQMTLAFATGRHVLEMRHILGKFDLHAFLITGNGTRVHSIEGELMHRSDLAPEVAEKVIHGQWDTKASMHLFNDTGWMTERDIPELLNAHVYSGFRPQVTRLKSIPGHEVTKICFCGANDDLHRLLPQLRETLGDRACFCFSAQDYLEVLPVGCNKGSALAALSAHLGLTLQDCMAFGDAMNDREMLSTVGHGLIMGNAMAELKTALPHLPVIGHCRDQAVAHYLTHWLESSPLTWAPE